MAKTDEAKVTTIKFQNSVERYVVTLRTDSIDFATPGLVGGLSVQKQIFYDEIVAVYQFRKPDWTVLMLGFLIGVLFGLGGWAFYAGAGAAAGGLVWVCGLLLIVYYIHQGLVRQKNTVRVVSPTAIIEFPCAKDQVFAELMSRLKVINARSSGTML